MRREAFDRVEKWRARHDGSSLKSALRATKTSPGRYYSQRKAVKNSAMTQLEVAQKRAVGKSSVEKVLPTYDVEVLEPLETKTVGNITISGTPDDLAKFLASLANGGQP